MQITLTLRTADGRVGAKVLTEKNSKMMWTGEHGDGDDQTISATFDARNVGPNGAVTFSGQLIVTGDVWREFESEAEMEDFLRDAVQPYPGALLSAMQGQVNQVESTYRHDECEEEWTNRWSCACDDECPSCGHDIEPRDSVLLSSIDEPDDNGIYALVTNDAPTLRPEVPEYRP